MTTVDSAAASLVLQLGCARAATMDLPALLSAVCTSLPSMVGAAGAVVLLGDPVDACYASDAQAGWIGEAQRRSGSGPLPNALRSGRPVVTPDLTRIGPPELAAAADQCGLTSSVVLLLEVDGERIGGLQLLGDAQRPVTAVQADLARPVADVLAARLADLRELERLRGSLRAAQESPPTTGIPVDAGDMATTALPAVPAPRPHREPTSNLVPGPRPSPRPAPAPRTAQPSQRHGRSEGPAIESAPTRQPGRGRHRV